MLSTKISLAVFLTCCAAINTCPQTNGSNRLITAGFFVASTPCDSSIKSLLTIAPDSKVDFVRWELTLNKSENKAGTFILNVAFGQAEPSTSGFKDGGKKFSFEGKYTVFRSP